MRDLAGETDTTRYAGIGEELRAARVRTGVDLPDAAVQLQRLAVLLDGQGNPILRLQAVLDDQGEAVRRLLGNL